MANIYFKNHKLEKTVTDGTDLLQVHKIDTSLPMRFGCTQGRCGICAVNVTKGKDSLTRMGDQEKATLEKKELDIESHRLACQCAVMGDVEVSFLHCSD